MDFQRGLLSSIVREAAGGKDEVDMVVGFKVFAEGMEGRTDGRDDITLFKPRGYSFRRSYKEEVDEMRNCP